jgi:hypothetical protein
MCQVHFQFARLSRLLILAILVAGAAGCLRPTYRGTVSALARPDAAEPTTFVLVPADEGIDVQELEYESNARLIQRMLEESGYSKVGAASEAKLVITLAFHLGEPSAEKVDMPAPVYGPVGSSTSTTYGTINQVPGGAVYSGTTYTYQNVGIVGYDTASFTIYTQLSRVELRAYSAVAEARSPSSEVWRVTSQSGMVTDDLRALLPFHILAIQPYIARTTPSGSIAVTIPLNDPRIAKLRGQ